MSLDPEISIVIPVYNCGETIAKCLDSLFKLDHPSYEVIIVDDGSSDGTTEIADSYEDVKVIRVENGGPSRARNIGVKAARGGLIAFTDGDCIVGRGWLRELEKGFSTPEVAGVGGDQDSPGDDTEFGKRVQEIFRLLGIVTYYMRTARVMGETEHNPSCNVAYRKSVLEEVGGFDEGLWPGEDVDLDVRILRRGYKLVYNPDAWVQHYRPGSYAALARMMRRYGASAWQLFRRYGMFRILNYEPILTVFGAVVATLVIIWNPWFSLLVLLPGVIFYLWFLFKTGAFQRSLQLTALMLIILLSWNWGFFTGFRYRPLG